MASSSISKILSYLIIALADQGHEVPVHNELNTISGGFSTRVYSTFKRKKYTREVMIVKA